MPGPPKLTKKVSFPSAFRVTHFRLLVSGPVSYSNVETKIRHTGVCEINTHLDGAGVFNVPTPLPVFQSWRKDAQQQLTQMSVYLTDRLHSPCACL